MPTATGITIPLTAPGVFDAATAVITQGAVVVPNVASVVTSNGSGNGTNVLLTLTSAQSATLVTGAITGVLTPSTGGTAGAAVLFAGTLLPGVVPATGIPDLDWQAGFPVVDLGTGTTVLGLGTKEWVHVPLSASDAVTGAPFDISSLAVSMALYNWLKADGPIPADFQVCEMIVRTSAPFGTFARARFDTVALALAKGSYRVQVNLTGSGDTVLLTAAGSLSVR